MSLRSFVREDGLLWEALLLSFGLHWLLFRAGAVSFQVHQKRVVEIDITQMGHLGMPGPVRKAAPPAPPPPPAPPQPAPKPQDWVKPAADQKVAPAPVPTQPAPAPAPEEPPAPPPPAAAPSGPPALPGEYGIGTGDNGPNVLSRLPQLLNLSDLGAILRRFYPQAALSEGREATVVLDIHIDTDGRVQSLDIVRSGGAEFDEAAKHVARLLKFTPAFLGAERVNVKMRQAIQFKLRA